jgi:putative toxin-antitoxin system antitoxin component (TIGR02293 family)
MLSPFMEDVLQAECSGISPRRLSEALKVSMSHLSEVTGLHRNTLTRNPQSPEVQKRLGDIARIITTAADMLGDDQRAIVWFRHQPLSGFDHKTAEELVASGHADAVLAHLTMLANGVYA